MDEKNEIGMIVAVAANQVIGADNDMPWHLSTDLKRFKMLTMGKPVIMGRRTFESIGKALPGRLNIVITRNPSWTFPDALRVGSLDEALIAAREHAGSNDISEIMIIGGGQIFKESMALADILYVTHVDAEPAGDTYFPEISVDDWQLTKEEKVDMGERDSAATRFCVYRRAV